MDMKTTIKTFDNGNNIVFWDEIDDKEFYLMSPDGTKVKFLLEKDGDTEHIMVVEDEITLEKTEIMAAKLADKFKMTFEKLDVITLEQLQAIIDGIIGYKMIQKRK